MPMHRITEILAAHAGTGTTFEQMSPGKRAYEQFFVDDLNNMPGNENEKDGYNCKICKNKAYIVKLDERPDGTFSKLYADCKCAETRRSIMRMKRSGLGDIIKDKTFDKFEDDEPWRQHLKSMAMAYATNPDGWFFLGGQSGAGKSHLCTAICREFLLKGKQVIYMLWLDDVAKLKGVANDPEQREPMINRFKHAEVLYIDDLFKTSKDKDKDAKAQRPSDADVRTAFEILNYRYCNPKLLTIISTEYTGDELLNIDEATGGRILEKSGKNGISMAEDRSRNYRLRQAVTI